MTLLIGFQPAQNLGHTLGKQPLDASGGPAAPTNSAIMIRMPGFSLDIAAPRSVTLLVAIVRLPLFDQE